MAWVITENRLGFPRIGDVDRSPVVPVGTIVTAQDTENNNAGEFIYMLGAANMQLGTAVTYDNAVFFTARASANAIGPIAFATAEIVGGTWGWYQIQGNAQVRMLASAAANNLLYLTATAGSLDDAVVAGDRVKGAVIVSGPGGSAGLGRAMVTRPYVDNIAD